MTGHPKISSAPIHDIIPSIQPNFKNPTRRGLTSWILSKLKHVTLHRQHKYLEFIKIN